MTIKAIAIDLDGTLLHEGHGMAITEDNRCMLQAAGREGIALCIATGRVDGEIVLLSEQLGVRPHRVSQNGAFLISADGDAWQSVVFEPDLARSLLALTDAADLVRTISSERDVYISGSGGMRDEIAARHFVSLLAWEDTAADVHWVAAIRPSKISIFGDALRLRELQEQAVAQFGHRVEAVMSQHDCMDIVPKGVTKATALHALLRRLELAAEEIATIGDSFNDVPMLEMTPNSYAMGHAHPDVKRKARYEAESVAVAIRRILAARTAGEGQR